MMIRFEYYDASHEEVYQWLAETDIERDDYDYVLFSECSVGKSRSIIILMKEQFLHGCCSNECYYVEDFFGKNGVIGIAYHS